MSEKKQRRSWTPDEKTEIVLAGLRGDRPVTEVCRAYEISETLYSQWRDRLLEGGKQALRRPNEKHPTDSELKDTEREGVAGARAGPTPQRIAQSERSLTCSQVAES